MGYNGICGTDLHEYYAGPIFVPTEPHPLTHQQLPLTLGHEFSGVITEVGAGVTGWAEGDRVAVEPIYKCDHCGPCRAGNYNVCQQIGFHGLMSDGGMAEFTVVPTSMLHRLPDNVSLELGALVEPMSVAYHAATLGDVRPVTPRWCSAPARSASGCGSRCAARDLTMCSSSSRRRRGAPPSRPWAPRRWTRPSLDVPSFIADHTKGNGADAVFDAAGVAPACRRRWRASAPASRW